MVKGVTRQVIVVQAPDEKLFEQAIFIVKENVPDVTDEMLLKEAKDVLRHRFTQRISLGFGPVWALGGAAATGIAWLLTALLR